MKVLLLENDDYAKRFATALGNKTDMQISICTELDVCRGMAAEGGYQLVLIDEAFDDVDPKEFEKRQTAVAFISSVRDTIKDTLTIYKYSNIMEIYSQLVQHYANHTQHEVKSADDDDSENLSTQVMTFLPVCGGAGSSTLAMAAAIHYSANHNVLYLNLEQRHAENLLFSSDEAKSVSDVISMLQTRFNLKEAKKLMDSVIQNDKSHSKGSGRLDFIRGYINIADAAAMTSEIAEALVSVLRRQYNYSYIIIDTDFIIGDVLKTLILNSDRLVFTSTGSDSANVKINGIHRYLEIVGRSSENPMPEKYLVFNQYYGMKEESVVARDMKICGRLGRYRASDHNLLSTEGIIRQMLAEDNLFADMN